MSINEYKVCSIAGAMCDEIGECSREQKEPHTQKEFESLKKRRLNAERFLGTHVKECKLCEPAFRKHVESYLRLR